MPSSTLFQVFGVVLEDVPYRAGRIRVGVYDVNRNRPGILSSAKKTHNRSECATDWAAEDGPRAPRGIALEDPLFVAHAPFAEWDPDRPEAAVGEETGWLQDYALFMAIKSAVNWQEKW